MTETIFSLMLDQLSTFIRQEGNLLGGLKEELQHISNELETMTAFLKVAEAKEEDDPRLQVWLKQVREVAYDIEDALDEFRVLSARHHADGLFRCFWKISNSIKDLRARHKIAKEIQNIKSSVTIISEAHQRYRLEFGIHHHSQEQRMFTISSHEKVHSPYNTQKSNYFKPLRSLITFGTIESTLLSKLLSSKLLKVLDLREVQLEEIPNQVFNLFHLRYLCLRGTKVKTVPKSIKKLHNLEHLHLGQTNVRELPVEILGLKKLRHLWVFQVVDASDVNSKCNGFKAPSKIGELSLLHSLRFIDAQNDETTIVGELGKLIQLRELGITKLRRQDGEGLCSSLQKLNKLHELDVTAIAKDEVLDMDHPLPSSSLQSLRGIILRGRLEKLPRWINSLQSLKKIDLIWSMLWSDDPLKSLQHLPNLAEVCLCQAYEGEGLCFNGGGFLKLETLNLRNMQGLKWIAVEDGAMPCLRRLDISELPQLEELPLGIQHLTELQSLHLGDMSSEFTEKLLNPDVQTGVRRKIAHIPEVVIGFRTAEEWKEYRL